MNRNAADIIAAIIWVALILVLVRPQSTAADAVTKIGAALAAMVRRATDLS